MFHAAPPPVQTVCVGAMSKHSLSSSTRRRAHCPWVAVTVPSTACFILLRATALRYLSSPTTATIRCGHTSRRSAHYATLPYPPPGRCHSPPDAAPALCPRRAAAGSHAPSLPAARVPIMAASRGAAESPAGCVTARSAPSHSPFLPFCRRAAVLPRGAAVAG